jgi:hypothetical protein
MSNLKEITPVRLRCTLGACPAVFESSHEELVIIGKKADLNIIQELAERIAEDEYAIQIRREFFENLKIQTTSDT